MNNAEARIRSFLERILRLKEDQDALGADIREVYKEAAGEGFNKTALGKVVTMIRAREKDADKLAALDADVALYLGAYDGTVPAKYRAHPHAPEAPVTPHDSDTGEVIETAAAEPPARNPGADDGRPSEPSSDEAPPAGVRLIGQSEQAIPVQSHIVREPAQPAPLEMPDLPAALDRRQKAAAG